MAVLELVTGIHLSLNSGVCGLLDTGGKPRYDNGTR